MKKIHTTPIDEAKVRHYAKLRDWTLSGLSIQMGMPTTFLSNRLREGTLSAEALKKLASLLGVDAAELTTKKQVNVDEKATVKNGQIEELERRVRQLEKELKELESACQKAVWRLLTQ